MALPSAVVPADSHSNSARMALHVFQFYFRKFDG
jgi:hypothetical protein